MGLTHTPTEDELVSLDELQEKLAEFEDFVQSSDVAAMQSKRAIYIFGVERASDFIPQSCKLRCESGCDTLGHVVDGCIGMNCKKITERMTEVNVFNVRLDYSSRAWTCGRLRPSTATGSPRKSNSIHDLGAPMLLWVWKLDLRRLLRAPSFKFLSSTTLSSKETLLAARFLRRFRYGYDQL